MPMFWTPSKTRRSSVVTAVVSVVKGGDANPPALGWKQCECACDSAIKNTETRRYRGKRKLCDSVSPCLGEFV